MEGKILQLWFIACYCIPYFSKFFPRDQPRHIQIKPDASVTSSVFIIR